MDVKYKLSVYIKYAYVAAYVSIYMEGVKKLTVPSRCLRAAQTEIKKQDKHC